MKNIQGFVTITDFIQNDKDNVPLIGELSTWSETYSMDRGLYRSPGVDGYELTTFSSIDDMTGVPFVLMPETVAQILQVVQTARHYAESALPPHDPLDFENYILLQHSSQLENVKIGTLVDYVDGALPEWISWESKVGDNSAVKIWLSDRAFRAQYEDSNILIIPPVENLDMFFGEYGNVIAELALIRPSILSDKMQEAKEYRPPTVSRMHDYFFYNSINNQQKTYVSWGILVYGAAGDNIDSIKDALVDFILKNSSHTRAEWEVIFPDIFKRTEFVVIPAWNNVSVDNITPQARLYSQIVNPTEAQEFIIQNFPVYTQAHVVDRMRMIPYPHKHLMLSMMSGAGNSDNNRYFEKLFPDYLSVPSTSLDFNRMSKLTRDWSQFMFDLIVTAETMTNYSTVPTKLRRVRRNGVLFISALYENVNYLVAARINEMFEL